MDSWPADTRSERAPPQSKKGRKRTKEKATSRRVNYPSVKAGELGAATLRDVDGRLEWSFLVNNDEEARKLAPSTSAVTIYPATRPPPSPASSLPIRRQAEQGANFVRKHFPDLDVEASLIRHELVQASKDVEKLSKFDPLYGSLLAILEHRGRDNAGSVHLVFPSGEIGSNLNFSILMRDKNDETVVKAASEPVRTLSTPILQISTSKHTNDGKGNNSFLATRTYAATFLYEVKSLDDEGFAVLDDFATITTEQLGGSPAVDIILKTCPFLALVVNSAGSVYRITNERDNFVMSLVHLSDRDADDYWRLAFSQDQNEYFLMSSKNLHLHTALGSTTIFSARDDRECLTAIEDETEDGVIRLCTTHQIVWLNKDRPDKPILAYHHARHFDRHLQIRTNSFCDQSLTILYTPRNKLFSVYDVSRDDTGILKLFQKPYSMSGPAKNNMSAYAFYHHPSNDGDQLLVIGLSITGELLATSLSGPTISRDWPELVQKMHREARILNEDQGPLSVREHIRVDFSELYERLFLEERPEDQVDEEQEQSADQVYELLDRIPVYWQSTEAPVEHMLTTQDIVNRSKDEDAQIGRADFLAENPLSSLHGFRAMGAGTLSTEIKSDSEWHFDIEKTLQQFELDVTHEVEKCFEDLKKYDVDNPEEFLADKALARQKLAVDLALSADIYAPVPFAEKISDELDDKTKRMSVGTSPPSVQFHFLRPLNQRGYYDSAEWTEERETVQLQQGVRSLLHAWDLGADPDTFIFEDPYQDTGEGQPNPESTFRVSPPLSRAEAIPTTQPPRIATQKTRQPPTIESQPIFAQTQIEDSAPTQQAASQPHFTSTQPLPGPFGGRPQFNGVKKKPAKKRMGGF